MFYRTGLVLGSLLLCSTLAMSDPGGRKKGDREGRDERPKHVTVPEGSPWPELLIVAVGIAVATRFVKRPVRN